MSRQDNIDTFFIKKLNKGVLLDGAYGHDLFEIKNTILHQMNIRLSSAESFYFWYWRSQEDGGSWLPLKDDENIMKWFRKFCDKFNIDINQSMKEDGYKLEKSAAIPMEEATIDPIPAYHYQMEASYPVAEEIVYSHPGFHVGNTENSGNVEIGECEKQEGCGLEKATEQQDIKLKYDNTWAPLGGQLSIVPAKAGTPIRVKNQRKDVETMYDDTWQDILKEVRRWDYVKQNEAIHEIDSLDKKVFEKMEKVEGDKDV